MKLSTDKDEIHICLKKSEIRGAHYIGRKDMTKNKQGYIIYIQLTNGEYLTCSDVFDEEEAKMIPEWINEMRLLKAPSC